MIVFGDWRCKLWGEDMDRVWLFIGCRGMVEILILVGL